MEEIIQPYEASLILEAHHFKDENNIKHINEYELKDKIGEGCNLFLFYIYFNIRFILQSLQSVKIMNGRH